MAEESTTTERFVLGLKDMPVLLVTVEAVLQVVNDESASGSDLEAVIERDQSLTGKILKVANSPAYGVRRSAQCVSEAILFIGTRRIRQIASAMALGPLFRTDEGGLVDGPALWAHALASAMWTREISSFLGSEQAHYLYSAALMHDIGIVIMWQQARESYSAVLQKAKADRVEHAFLEEESLGTTHARVGAMLCERWHMDSRMAELVDRHHDEICPEKPELRILRLADNLAGEVGAPEFGWSAPVQLPDGLLEEMGLGDEELGRLMEKADAVRAGIALF